MGVIFAGFCSCYSPVREAGITLPGTMTSDFLLCT